MKTAASLLKMVLGFCGIMVVTGLSAQVLRQEKKYIPNQVLIKLKDEVTLRTDAVKNNVTGIDEVDNLLKTYPLKKVASVFLPVTQNKLTVPANGLNNLSVKKNQFTSTQNKRENFLQLAFDKDSIDVLSLVDRLKALPSVEFAEPNYIFSLDAVMDKTFPVIRLQQQKKLAQIHQPVENKLKEELLWGNERKLDFLPPVVSPNDPLFSQQANLIAANVQNAWEVTTGDSTVVAVLDTGVDWTHPDLKDNIWINWAEYFGQPGVDDDGDGLVDDIRGWDYVNNDNDPADDNSHGTHVAGIIAAKGNNGIGVSGVNWNAKIMCLKVLQSTGRGDAATIAKAVDYASNKGAKIINLSLGGYYESMTLKTSLQNADANCLIVAAAGNDATCIGPGVGCAPFYPAAYSFVMGVQDQATYSNYDQDGPFSSQYPDLLNYDTHAPGSSVTSTIPDGGYTTYTGTSMATPVVAGIASLYMGLNKNYDKELLFTQLVQQQTNGFVDAYKVLTNVPTPDLRVAKYEIVDTAANCNNNSKPDAGENINLRIYLKNYSARADGVSVKVSYAPLADTSLVHFIQDSCFVGSVSPNTLTYSLSPLNIKIADKVAHGADYKIKVVITDTKGNSWSDQVVITFQNATALGGIITNDLTLYPNKYYNVTDNVIINGCKLVIKPGTILNFSPGKSLRTNNGVVIALGKKDSVITFTSSSVWSGMQLGGTEAYDSVVTDYDGTPVYKYPKFDTLLKGNFLQTVDTIKSSSICKYCILENMGDFNTTYAQISGGTYVNSIFRNYNGWISIGEEYGPSGADICPTIISTNFMNNKASNSAYTFGYYRAFNNYINNVPYQINAGPSPETGGMAIQGYPYNNNYGTNVFDNSIYDLYAGGGSSTINIPSGFYLGTTDSMLISRHLYDYFDDNNSNAVIIQNYRTTPCDSCPGIVWKMTIDGKEFASNTAHPEDIVEIGVHQLKVWFNRQMDTTVTPVLSFGQSDPYNQVSIPNKGVWAKDGKSYTVSREFVVTDPNGIVTFSVSAAKDTMGMEIPYERTRFRINLQSSSSKSLNFAVTPQCGKLYLNWDNLRTQGSDIIGYNLYRRIKLTNHADTFALLNDKLVLNHSYTDYKVNIDSAYDYVYTAVRDGMNSETDSSFIVSGQPLHSKLGDANGDSSINVADIVTAVNKILQKTPQPFIFQQTDMNNDGVINVLDVIGIINRILSPGTGGLITGYDYNSTLSAGKVNLYLSGDTLWANSDVKIGGIEYSDVSIKQWISSVAGWEKVSLPYNPSRITNKMAYTFSETLEQQKDIPLGLVNTDIDPRNWLISSDDGRPVDINWLGNISKNMVTASQHVKVSQAYPNPVHDQFTFCLDNDMDISTVTIELSDMAGRIINNYSFGNWAAGINIKTISAHQLTAGVYKMIIRWNENGNARQQIISIMKD